MKRRQPLSNTLCVFCNKEFTPKRIDTLCCSVNCSSKLYYRMGKRPKHKTKLEAVTLSLEEQKPLYEEIKKFIYGIKDNNYNITGLESIQIVHYYDLIKPKLIQIPNMSDLQKSCDKMFFELCMWYKDMNEKMERFL